MWRINYMWRINDFLEARFRKIRDGFGSLKPFIYENR